MVTQQKEILRLSGIAVLSWELVSFQDFINLYLEKNCLDWMSSAEPFVGRDVKFI